MRSSGIREHPLQRLMGEEPLDKPPHQWAADDAMRNPLPKEVIEKEREVAHDDDESKIPEGQEEKNFHDDESIPESRSAYQSRAVTADATAPDRASVDRSYPLA